MQHGQAEPSLRYATLRYASSVFWYTQRSTVQPTRHNPLYGINNTGLDDVEAPSTAYLSAAHTLAFTSVNFDCFYLYNHSRRSPDLVHRWADENLRSADNSNSGSSHTDEVRMHRAWKWSRLIDEIDSVYILPRQYDIDKSEKVCNMHSVDSSTQSLGGDVLCSLLAV